MYYLNLTKGFVMYTIKIFAYIIFLLKIGLFAYSLNSQLNTIKICTAGGFIPFTYFENGYWQGFDIDMMTDFSKSQNKKIEIINYNIDGIIPALIAKKCELISSGLVVTENRKKSVQFSTGYFKSSIILLYRKDNKIIEKISNNEELNQSKYRIGVKIGTTNDFYAAKHLSQVTLLKFNEYGDLVNSVRNKKVDAILIDSTYGKYLNKKFPGIFLFKNNKDTEQSFGVAFRKDDNELLTLFEKFFLHWKETGKYKRTYDKYFE